MLLVDDSRDLPALLERAFRQAAAGTVVFPLACGERAIEHLLGCGEKIPLPDLVLLDRVMPGGMDGFETLEAIRRVERLLGVPVLMISGSDDDAHVARARVVGADGYLRKPVQRDELVRFARAVMGWRREESWRTFGGPAAGLELAVAVVGVESASHPLTTMPAATLSPSALPIPQDPNVLVRLYEHFRDVVRQTFDPVELAINEACRRHHIPPGHARGKGQDQVTVRNRHRVILDLMEAGYSDRVILENFGVSQRQIERLRAAASVKVGGLLADGKN